MRVVVLGGAGYVGSHAARALARTGYEVHVYDNLSSGYVEFTKRFALVIGDIRDRQTLFKTIQGAEAVLHFAAHAYVGESVSDPRKYFANNVEGSLCVLNACVDAGVKNVVFSSTCATYGSVQKVPIADDTPQNPVNPYGASKLFFEHALRAYDRAYGIRSVALRYFNAAGADESGEIGEIHKRETRLIPAALEAVLGERPDFQIFGDDYATPDGTCVRDYIHVNDLAQAHVLALGYLLSGGESTAFNLGTGNGSSVREVLNTIRRVTGCNVPTRLAPRRPGDPAILVADPSRAYRVLNWKAERDLCDMVSTAWGWMKSEHREIVRRGSRIAIAS
jgi:UDP-glucose-4-epimerase GalE